MLRPTVGGYSPPWEGSYGTGSLRHLATWGPQLRGDDAAGLAFPFSPVHPWDGAAHVPEESPHLSYLTGMSRGLFVW